MDYFPAIHRFFFGLILLWVCVFLPMVWLTRRRSVREGGPLLLAVLRPHLRRWHLAFFAAWVLAITAQWGVTFVRPLSFDERLNLANQTLIVLGAAALGQAGFPRWSLEFRLHGIVDHALLYPWPDVREFKWGDKPGLLRVWYRRRGIVHYRLDPRQQAAVDEMLQARVNGDG